MGKQIFKNFIIRNNDDDSYYSGKSRKFDTPIAFSTLERAKKLTYSDAKDIKELIGLTYGLDDEIIIEELILEREELVVLGSKFRHFKGNHYMICSIARDSETYNKVVIYTPLYTRDQINYVRPLHMFLSKIDPNREDNTTHQEYRFQFIEEIK